MADTAKLVEQVVQSSAYQNMSAPLQTAIFMGALVFVPAILVSVTGFTRIAIVLSFARRAVTSQDIPPNSVILGLSMFLTLFVMGPTFEHIHEHAISPFLDNKISGDKALDETTATLKKFMLRQTRRQDLALFIHLSKTQPPQEAAETPFWVVVPAFMISELKTAFTMGFCIYVPFLLVDLVVASLLTSLGMVMMPPVVVSASFKLLLFVLADGWHLVARALSSSFA
jgi:flagellar biosynthetic protein FliP